MMAILLSQRRLSRPSLLQRLQNYDSKNHYIELSVPISNPNDKDSKIEGALVVSVSTDNISLNMSYLTQIAVTVAIIAGAVVLFFGVLVLLHLFCSD